jgi:hypothetical protein
MPRTVVFIDELIYINQYAAITLLAKRLFCAAEAGGLAGKYAVVVA